MVQRETSVVRQHRLRAELRRIREKSGRTQKVVAEALGWSTSKVIRIEKGSVNVSTSDVMALLHYYRIDDPFVADDLLAAARARDEGWWDGYRPFCSQQFVNFLGYEDSATRIRQYMGLVVPGLLQTEEYARALVDDGHKDREEIEREIRIRMRRQELLDRPNCPALQYVIDEACLHRWVGGPDAMRRQLNALKEATLHPSVSIRIVPFTVGVYAGMQGSSFTIFDVPSLAPVIIIEDPEHDVNLDGQDVSKYVETFGALQHVAQEGDVDDIIGSIIEKMRLGANV